MEHDQETGEVYTNGHAKPQQRREPRNQPAYDMLGAALGKAVKDLPPFIANNKTGKFPYADLRTILEVVKPALQAHDIRIRQGEETSFSFDEGGGMKGRLSVVYTDLVHTPTGQYERTQITIPYTKLDAQGVGSALTYGRRYTLLAALGMTNAEADDDGESTMPVQMDGAAPDSGDLVRLKGAIDKVKTPTELIEWRAKAENVKAYNRLSEGERERLKLHYDARGKALTAAE